MNNNDSTAASAWVKSILKPVLTQFTDKDVIPSPQMAPK